MVVLDNLTQNRCNTIINKSKTLKSQVSVIFVKSVSLPTYLTNPLKSLCVKSYYLYVPDTSYHECITRYLSFSESIFEELQPSMSTIYKYKSDESYYV